MSKKQEYQAFVLGMRNVCNRPCLLGPLFARGLSFEEADRELETFRRQGTPMFKDGRHGTHSATKKNRIVTLDLMQRLVIRAALDRLQSLYGRRMTPEARQWREDQMAALQKALSRA